MDCLLLRIPGRWITAFCYRRGATGRDRRSSLMDRRTIDGIWHPDAMTIGENLFPGPPATLLPDDPAAADLAAGASAEDAVRAHPASSLAWADLADEAWDAGHPVESYAYARVGYHRGLDALRRNGWKGHGPVPWSHEPNQGFLRCLRSLARAAGAIGEMDEVDRIGVFLDDCDPSVPRD